MEDTNVAKRWENYRLANSMLPSAREEELKEVFDVLSPKVGEHILEVGTGNGYLTFPVAKAIGTMGEIVTADAVDKNLQDVVNRNKEGLPIEPIYFEPGSIHILPLNIGQFDAVTSIATLHHFDNRKNLSGEKGRTRALAEFYNVLRPGGRLVLADVADDTISQKYFDAIDNPQHCYPNGHPHDFFTPERLKELLEEIGFKNVSVYIKRVPWRFVSREQAQNFVHTIHNAICSGEDSFRTAESYLGFQKVGDHYELGWELFFAKGEK